MNTMIVMRKILKYFIPLISLLYCTAVFEVEIVSNHQQTFGDEFDSYTKSYSQDFEISSKSLNDYHLGLGIFPIALVPIEATLIESLSATLKSNRCSQYFDSHYIKNCCWLI